MTRRSDERAGSGRGRVWRYVLAIATAAGMIGMGGQAALADDTVVETAPPPVVAPADDSAEPAEPVIVAVGLAPVPPTAWDVEVEDPPLPPVIDPGEPSPPSSGSDAGSDDGSDDPAANDHDDGDDISGSIAGAIAASAGAAWRAGGA